MAIYEVSASDRFARPYAQTGVVSVTWSDGTTSYGTCSVVGRNDILTAGHLVYNPDRGGWATDFDFYFGADYNPSTNQFDSRNWTYSLENSFRWYAFTWPSNIFSDSYNSTNTLSESQYDIAIIGVSIPLGDITGWLGLESARDFSQQVRQIGYPAGSTGMMTGEVGVSRSQYWGVYESFGSINNMGGGSSGGPLITSDNNVIGVKTSITDNGSTWADLGFVWNEFYAQLSSNDSLLGGLSDDYSASTATSGDLGIGSSISARIETVGDKDWFRVVLVAGRIYKFDAEKVLGGLNDPYITMFSNSGIKLAEDDDSGGEISAQLRYTALTSGIHYLEVKQSPEDFSTKPKTGLYNVRASDISPPDDYAATTLTTGSLLVGSLTNGVIEIVGDKDWFKISLVAGRRYTFSVEKISGGLGDPCITLFSGVGTQLAQDDDSGEGINAQLIFTATASGIHFLEVKQSPSTVAPNPSTGGYTTRASELFPTYQLTSSANSVNEGASVTFNLSTSNIATGTTVPYMITGVSASDVVGGMLSGSFTIGENGKGSITLPISVDTLTEGSETLTITAGGSSIAVAVNDTSKRSNATTVDNEIRTFMTMKDVLLGDFSYLNYGTRTMTNTVFGSQYTVIYGTLSDDVIVGTADTDWIAGYAGKDNISAGAGNDHIFPGGGGDFGDAGEGLDTLYFSGTFASYTVFVTKSNGYTTVIDKLATPAEGVCTFAGMERIEFSDTMLAVDVDGAAGKAYRVYKAAFARDPMAGDKAGLGYWINNIDKGMDMSEVAARFIDSNEFRSLYGQNPTNAEFLAKVYTNVLGRTPDQGGYSWWLNELNTNPLKTKAKVLSDFAESQENKDSVVTLIGTGIEYVEYSG
jgi:V8-like Glu-specific endopeptidase